MSDTYQAVYDAVRSRFGGCDVGEAIRSAIHLDGSFAIEGVRQDFSIAAYEMHRPSVFYRPAIAIEGNMWCALYGSNLKDGVAGFGESPALAMQDFDINWSKSLESAK